jgi:energy-coupling factor transport system permease protein
MTESCKNAERAFMERYNPIVIFIYFVVTSGIAMLCMNPVIQTIGLVGAFAFFLVRRTHGGGHLRMLGLAMLVLVVNPLFTHNGATVLFFLNGNPITQEAFLYGAACGIMLLAMLYWFRSFSVLMTSDKLLFLLKSLSPKLALVLSMALRYVSLFTSQWRKTAQAQKAMGMIRDDGIVSRVQGGIRIFSVTLTWALENGIVTADGMAARGYGSGRRTSFALYRFYRRDGVILSVIGILFLAATAGILSGAAAYQYYPTFSVRYDLPAMLTYGAYGVLVALPSAIEAGESIKWKYLQSKI